MKFWSAISLCTVVLNCFPLNAGTLPEGKMVESLTLSNVSMKEAARLIATAAGMPVIVSSSAAKVTVDVHLRNVSVETVLKSICRASGLWYQKNEKEGFLHVMTAEEFRNSLCFDRSEKVEVVQILYPSAKDVGDALAKLYADRVIWIPPRRNSGDSYSDISKALKRMDLLGKRGTFELSDSEEATGTNDENYDEEYGRPIGNAEKTVNPDLSNVDINKLRTAVPMGEKSQWNGLKINKLLGTPGVVFISALPGNNSLLLRSGDVSAIEEILKVIEKLDKPIPQVLLEVKVLSIILDDGRERALDFLFSSNDGSVSGGFANGSLDTNGGAEILRPTPFDPDSGAGLLPQGSGLSSKAAVFSAVSKNFKARLQMLESNERVTALATPNLIVSNNESSTLFIGTETTVMEKAQSTTTYKENSVGGTQPVVSWQIDAPRRKIGMSLLITPKIHADKTVTLRLLQENSELGEQQKNVYSGGSTAVQNSEEQYFITQDIALQRLVTTVVGHDQDFMVIGGLIQESVSRVSEKTPLLSEIPVLGDLFFTRMQAMRARRETLIIIRPFVMLAPGESFGVSKDYLERLSQHPSAREDLPGLGVNIPNELAKPKVINPADPWLLRMFEKLRGWDVDDKFPFDVSKQRFREERRENYRGALKEIERIQKDAH